MYNTIVLEREEPIAILQFNRPNVLNALNRQVFLEMISIFEEIQKEVVPKVAIDRALNMDLQTDLNYEIECF